MVTVGSDRNGESVRILRVFRVIPGAVALVDVRDIEHETFHLQALASRFVGSFGSVDFAFGNAFFHERSAQSAYVPSVELGKPEHSGPFYCG
jgi:hypothetical protein